MQLPAGTQGSSITFGESLHLGCSTASVEMLVYFYYLVHVCKEQGQSTWFSGSPQSSFSKMLSCLRAGGRLLTKL